MDTPLAQFFLFHDRKWNNFSCVTWLLEQPDHILERISEYSALFFDIDDDKLAEFDRELNEADDEDMSDESFNKLDYASLCYMIAEKEVESREDVARPLSEKEEHNALIGLSTFAVIEGLRRKNVAFFEGEGTIYEFDKDNTNVGLTEDGKKLGSSMQTMHQLATMVEE